MTELITAEVLDDFQSLTQYDIRSFFNRYIEFVDDHYADIVNYFSGVSDIVPQESFSRLNSLSSDHKNIVDVVILNNHSLANYEYWIVVEYIEDIGTFLETAMNTSKWVRSSSISGGYRNGVRQDVMMGQGETIEDVERNKVLSPQFQETWIDTAIQNNLREEDYDSSGGKLIKGILQGDRGVFLNGVVDNIDTPEKTYGLDIDRNIIFENNDLKTLSYRDTILQCAEILCSLKQGDDPGFPDRGINRQLIGSNIASITYPSIFRQLSGNFATDDSFRSISIEGIRREQDGVFIEVQIETRAGSIFNDSVQL